MKIAFCLYKYLPYGGMQRDCMAIASHCAARGHQVRFYAIWWQDVLPENMEVRLAPVAALSRYKLYRQYADWLHEELRRNPVDRSIGFNEIPDLDFYFAADGCFAERLKLQAAWRACLPRSRYFLRREQQLCRGRAHLLPLTPGTADAFERHHGVNPARMTVLKPQLSGRSPEDDEAEKRRRAIRAEFGIDAEQILLLMVGAGFGRRRRDRKGLDRALRALASLRRGADEVRLLAVGGDIGVLGNLHRRLFADARQAHVIAAREDIPDLMLGSDLLLHPARWESAGNVLIEALASGLPVLCTDICGFAPMIRRAEAGVALPHPFRQRDLNKTLAEILADPEILRDWKRNALNFARDEPLSGRAEQVADLLEAGHAA